MSSFQCPQCRAEIIDINGYKTGCEHYPLRVSKPVSFDDQFRSVFGQFHHKRVASDEKTRVQVD